MKCHFESLCDFYSQRFSCAHSLPLSLPRRLQFDYGLKTPQRGCDRCTVVPTRQKVASAPQRPTMTAILGAKPGVQCDITVEAPNFKKHIENGVKVNVSDHRTVDINLKLQHLGSCD